MPRPRPRHLAVLGLLLLFLFLRPSPPPRPPRPTPAPTPRPSDAVLVLVLSAPRAVDYVASLVRRLTDAEVVVMSSEDRQEPRLRGRDKHGDPPDRARWRAKAARDMRAALSFGLLSGRPYFVVLEDDVAVGANFTARVREMGDAGRSWALMNAPAFDQGRAYAHGDAYVFEACTQGMLYRVGPELRGLVAAFDEHAHEDPADWIIRDHQRKTGHRINLAVPNLVQHVGAVSSLASKTGTSGCVSATFSP